MSEAQTELLKFLSDIEFFFMDNSNVSAASASQAFRLSGQADAMKFYVENLHGEAPIDMLIFCPGCGKQHIDEAKPDVCEMCGKTESDHLRSGADSFACPSFTAWLNPPHKSHRCGDCNLVFRVADVPTNGVAQIKTKGDNDSWPEVRND